MIDNPVLPGFHPDPSIVRAEGRYVIATSTFEWFPGVSLHASDDLRHWRPVGHVLTDPEILDLRGIPDSAGIWAPSLSYAGGRYWLLYTVVRTMTGPHKDLDNYLVTADSIEGPWSEPCYLNSSGFDPSLYHAPDGRTYVVNVNWDHRTDRFAFGGVLLQEYDQAAGRLVGPSSVIYRSDVLMEGSHLFQRGGWIYLMLAEGGTGYEHGIRLARSRDLRGPYEIDPEPLLTSRDDPTQAIQKAGHGQLVTTPDGEHYIVHLGARPVVDPNGYRCPLGRETFLQRVVWTDDGWLRLDEGGHHPRIAVRAPAGSDAAAPAGAPVADASFSGPEWMSLRVARSASWIDETTRPGWLRLRGRESLDSLFHQSVLMRRLTSLTARVVVTVDAVPDHFSQLAGLVVYYNTSAYHFLAVTHDERLGRVVRSITVVADDVVEGPPVPLPPGAVALRADISGLRLTFSAEVASQEPITIAPNLDLGQLSDEIGPPLRFTGTMVGICCQDLARRAWTADFEAFALTDV